MVTEFAMNGTGRIGPILKLRQAGAGFAVNDEPDGHARSKRQVPD
jgi:hypothetical protein